MFYISSMIVIVFCFVLIKYTNKNQKTIIIFMLNYRKDLSIIGNYAELDKYIIKIVQCNSFMC